MASRGCVARVNQKTPWSSSFHQPSVVVPIANPALVLTALATENASAKGDEVKLEITYWESVAESSDPTTLRSYFEEYPNGHFKDLAEARLRRLESKKNSDL